MKKVIAVIMAAVLCAGLCGCAKNAKEEVSPEDAIAPHVERFVKSKCRLNEDIYDETYDSLYIGDILKNPDGDYDVNGVYSTVDKDGEKRSYAFTMTARYYSDGTVRIDENSFAKANTDYLLN